MTKHELELWLGITTEIGWLESLEELKICNNVGINSIIIECDAKNIIQSNQDDNHPVFNHVKEPNGKNIWMSFLHKQPKILITFTFFISHVGPTIYISGFNEWINKQGILIHYQKFTNKGVYFPFHIFL